MLPRMKKHKPAPKIYLILEASAGALFGYTMYAYQRSDQGLGLMPEIAIPSGIIGGLVVFGLSHAMTLQLMPRNRKKVLVAFNLTLLMMAFFFNHNSGG